MGAVRLGIPEEEALFLKQEFLLNLFVETGTLHGGTAVWGSSHFERVITIESAPLLWQAARKRHGHVPNIDFRLGESSTVLNALIDELREPALFWLDAHWSAGDTYGEHDECPLLAELSAVRRSQLDHVILIDDARLFLAPPPRPHRMQFWPSIGTLIRALEDGNRFHVVVNDDVVFAVPAVKRQRFLEFLQDRRSAVASADRPDGWRQSVARLLAKVRLR